MTDKEVRMILHHVIDRCNWCRNQNIRCEECNELYGPCRRNMAILDLGKYFEPDWIPCSERLPESYKVVVASIRAETGYIKKPYVWDVCKAYVCGDGSWETSLTGTRNLVVEAWMPLPEPYKESE